MSYAYPLSQHVLIVVVSHIIVLALARVAKYMEVILLVFRVLELALVIIQEALMVLVGIPVTVDRSILKEHKEYKMRRE